MAAGARNPENHSRLGRPSRRIMSGTMDYLSKGRRVIGIEADELRRMAENLDGEAFGRAIEALRE
jgi:hypothetical protein